MANFNQGSDKVWNSLLGSVFMSLELSRKKRKYNWPRKERLDNLSVISSLYIYTEPAPNGYGTPAPKVAETVLRAWGFNLKGEGQKSKQIGDYSVNWAAWDVRDPYPFDKVTGNWHPGEAHRMYKIMLQKNFREIKEHCIDTIQRFLVMNSDVLTRGRQTWDSIRRKSVPSPTAYQEMATLFQVNLNKDASNCLEWIQMFFEMCNLKEIKTKEKVERIKKTSRYDPKHKQRIVKTRIMTSFKTKTVKGEAACRKYMFNLSRDFCSYIKHGERAKLNRRAIASPNMIKRMFFKIIEQFHLDLAKELPGSTISIGGEEKKRKIITNLTSATTLESHKIKQQATQDATKWNECLSPECFMMMHRTFFDPSVREELGLDPPTDMENLFLRICTASHWILANKRITLGEGPTAIHDGKQNRLAWKVENMDRMNTMTRAWFRDAIKYLEEDELLLASPGMLMGMHNAASTTLALAATNYRQPSGVNVVTLRSSDDSMTVFVADSPSAMINCIEWDRKTLKLLGVNLSPDKSFLFPHQYGEYTSWYQDGRFVAQYGVETSAIRPQGKNPHDDFHSIAKSVQVGLNHLTVNPIGGECWLRIGIDNVRRLYRIKRRVEPREGVKKECLLLSDGGPMLWDVGNCHLEETAVKEYLVTTREEEEYFLRINNPETPFRSGVEEEIAFSKEAGDLVMTLPEIPRNAFTYVKRANRTIKNVRGPTHEDEEKASSEVMKIVNTIDVTTQLRVPSSKHKISEHITSHLEQLRSELTLNDEEQEAYDSAMKILSGEREECMDDDGAYDDDLDMDMDLDI